jgi:glycine/D-amino acid oxidase-like deaminating enzyme
MTPDGSPIYEQSETCPGAFIAMVHSGVSLAPQHAFLLADYVAAGAIPEEATVFSTRRFRVPAPV